MRSYSDLEILKGIKKNDNEIFRFFYQHYFPKLLKFVSKNHGTDEEAADIFQEAIIGVFKNIISETDFKLNSSFFTYFCSVFRNQWLWYFRTKNNRSRMINAYDFMVSNDNIVLINDKFRWVDDGDVVEYLHKQARENLYLKYFDSLKEDCKKIINYAHSGYSMKEIAVLMKFKNEFVAKNTKYQCVTELKRRILEDPLYAELKDSVTAESAEI